MHIALAILQVLLALHTAMGAYWKLSHSEKTVPSLAKIPHPVWLGMLGLEAASALTLLLGTFYAPMAHWAPVATIVIGLEMLFLCATHLISGNKKYNPMFYWLVVAVICAAMAYASLVLKF